MGGRGYQGIGMSSRTRNASVIIDVGVHFVGVRIIGKAGFVDSQRTEFVRQSRRPPNSRLSTTADQGGP